MFFNPLSTNSCLMSFMMTFRPLMAATWAMPLPIWPAPITPKTFTCISFLLWRPLGKPNFCVALPPCSRCGALPVRLTAQAVRALNLGFARGRPSWI